MSSSYDPRRLVTEVARLLAEHGVEVDRSKGSLEDRIAGSGMLLRGLGVTPAAAPEDTLDLDGHRGYNARIHGD